MGANTILFSTEDLNVSAHHNLAIVQAAESTGSEDACCDDYAASSNSCVCGCVTEAACSTSTGTGIWILVIAVILVITGIGASLITRRMRGKSHPPAGKTAGKGKKKC
ncbi:hypothetical protein [Candidatus Formimonas warabiya]|uniref:Uncharacterized protein n=1 Tax=Formimonas warabiya TaxID=1761012 RepID=A0A3G1KTV7_FORW1|nr:hypothetical protein [Candidatus Formimonas warabiya]ATW25595.1 hypothetical protein DCMF_13255 [Candidatus Formimonas warabiya]